MPRTPTHAAEAEVVTVAELAVGDYLVEFAPQLGIAGMRVGSGIARMTPAQDWGMSPGYRRRRVPVDGHRIELLRGATITLPDTHRVTVRRKLAQVSA